MLDVDGTIEFDQVDVYFGERAGMRVPTSEKRPVSPTDETQRLYHRLYAMDDEWGRENPRTSWSYFIPPVGENMDLGDYVLVIASRDGSPKGVGEYFNFEVPKDDGLYRYHIPLVPVENEDLETWGKPDRDCARWSRQRQSMRPYTIAVVRDNDHDCDSFLDDGTDSGDCEPMLYCDGSGTGDCIGRTPCVAISGTACIASPECKNQEGVELSCKPVTCLEQELCTKGCTDSESTVLLQCAIEGAHTAADYNIPLNGDKTLCSNPYTLSVVLPFPCAAPAVESSGNALPSNSTFMFSIAPSGSAVNTCELTISSAAGAPFDGVPHILISIDGPMGSVYERVEFVLGLQPGFPCTHEAKIGPISTNVSSCGF